MTTPTENQSTETAPAVPTVSVTVASGHTLMSMDSKGDHAKIHRPGAALDLPQDEAARLEGLGFVIVPEKDASAEGSGEEAAQRAKARPSISPKDGPRVDR